MKVQGVVNHSYLSSSSLRHIGEMDDIKKHDRFYLRYYLTIKRARLLNQEIYGQKLDKAGKQLLTKHPLRVASHTQAIKNQRISDYHMTWLVGVLHDSKEDHLTTYTEKIDEVLGDLLPQERDQVKLYIDQLTSDEMLSTGEKKAQQIKKMEIMELVPCWIRIFDKYDNCRRFKEDPVGKKPQKIQSYYSIAYLCYKRACQRFEQIKKNLQPYIHEFYADILTEVGGIDKIKKAADKYIAENS